MGFSEVAQMVHRQTAERKAAGSTQGDSAASASAGSQGDSAASASAATAAAVTSMHCTKALARVKSAKKEQDERHLMEAWVDAAVTSKDSSEAISQLVAVADRFAEKAEAEARARDSKEWKAWATTDQECKSGRRMPSRAAFQWARSPSGWTKPALGAQEDEDEVPDDPDYEDHGPDNALSDPKRVIEKESRLWRKPEAIPLGAQAEVNQTANAWAKLWDEDGQYLAAITPDDTTRLPPSTETTSSRRR